jgi:cobalt-zinc-cadmium efflux system protein
MICRAFVKLIEPTEVHYGGVTVFAIVGLLVNLIAALITGRGESLSERAVRLHLIEDVLGWAITLIGAVVMHITGLTLFDALISIGVSVFILSEAIGNLKESIEELLDKAPRDLDILKLKERIGNIDGVSEVISLRVRSIGEKHNHACVHILCAKGREEVKSFVRKELEKSGISDATIEL